MRFASGVVCLLVAVAAGGVARAQESALEVAEALADEGLFDAPKVTPPAPDDKLAASKEYGRAPDKLPLVAKIKECCGYPISEKEGFRLSFYWIAYESEYANEPYDTAIYTRAG